MQLYRGNPKIFQLITVAAPFLLWCPQAVAQAAGDKGGCEPAAPARSPTATAKGPDSGTKNMGSTGWSGGGMGGSHNDTAQAGPLPESKTEQPATAQGLDPTKAQQQNNKSPC